MGKLTMTFEVHDDLTSERMEQYRQAVINAMEEFLDSPAPTDEERDLTDKMLNDWERTE